MEGLWKTLFNWMIWGYHYFRKHPYLHFEVYIFSNATYRRSGWMMRSDGLLIQSLNPLKTGSPSRNIARCFIFPNSLQVLFLFQISGWWIWILTYILSHWFEYIYVQLVWIQSGIRYLFEAICFFPRFFGLFFVSLDVQANTEGEDRCQFEPPGPISEVRLWRLQTPILTMNDWRTATECLGYIPTYPWITIEVECVCWKLVSNHQTSKSNTRCTY